jgi:aspartate aminotransferase
MGNSSAEKTTFAARIGRIQPSATMAVVAAADKLAAQGIDVVSFGAGEPHFDTPQHIKQAGIDAISQNFTRYTAVGGTTELKDAIAHRFAEDFGARYQRDEIIASVGAKQALFNAFQVLVDHDDEVIIPVPYWVSFKDIVEYGGGKAVFVPTDEAQGFRLTAAAIAQAITPRTKVILLNSPSNPSGASISPEDTRAIVELAASKGIIVFCDETYVYLNYEGKTFSASSLTEFKPNMVVFGSMSKTYAMTGWRLGFALGPANVIKQMQKLQSQSTSNPTSVVQKASVAALMGSQQCVKDMAVEYVKLRDLTVKGLREIPGVQCHTPQGAFYVYPNIKAYLGKGGIHTTIELANALLEKAHVAVVPGEAFGTTEHIRLSYATSAEQIAKGLERIKKFFAEL